jgi:LysR family carnitine catabolism transcriptional activator
MNLSLKHLQAFTALCGTLNFTRAARLCHLSQPAFSALIQGLEEGVGVQLFERSTRSVQLTPAGKDFEPQAHRLLGEMDEALEKLRGVSTQQSKHVCIALLPSLAAHWLPTVLEAFAHQQPHIKVTVKDVLNAPCCEAVLNGQADLGLASALSSHPELQSHAVANEHFFIACHAKHRWATCAEAIEPSALINEPFIQMAPSTSVRQAVDQWAAQHLEAPLNQLMEVEQLATVMGMVRAGFGVSLIPALSLEYFQDPNVAICPLRGAPPQRTIYWVSSKHRQLSPAAKSFYSFASGSLESWLLNQHLSSALD